MDPLAVAESLQGFPHWDRASPRGSGLMKSGRLWILMGLFLILTGCFRGERQVVDGQYIRVRACRPAWDARRRVIKDIRRASRDIWEGVSQHPADQKIHRWAHQRFESKKYFTQFMINWAHVETGGHFKADHENWSRNGTEQNVGIFQLNQTWAVRHDTYGDGDSNPKFYGVKEAQEPYLAAHWALYHLLALSKPAQGNLTKMLDAYWHGTFDDPSDYATGIYQGHIIDHPE